MALYNGRIVKGETPGREGGRSRSKEKQLAARINGRKGGRPKGSGEVLMLKKRISELESDIKMVEAAVEYQKDKTWNENHCFILACWAIAELAEKLEQAEAAVSTVVSPGHLNIELDG